MKADRGEASSTFTGFLFGSATRSKKITLYNTLICRILRYLESLAQCFDIPKLKTREDCYHYLEEEGLQGIFEDTRLLWQLLRHRHVHSRACLEWALEPTLRGLIMQYALDAFPWFCWLDRYESKIIL